MGFNESRGDHVRRKRAGPGIATIAIVAAIIAILAVAALGTYFVVASGTSTSRTVTTSRASSASTGSASSHASSSKVTETTSAQSGLTYYSGTFNYSIPVGPSGVRSLPNGSAQYYNSTQVATGTFSFFIAAQNYSGSGSGHGTYTVTTRGFCTGSETFSYTFIIPDATTILGGNITVFFANPVPANYSVSLTCTGDMEGVSTATNNPGPYLPVYPNELTIPLASLPASEVFHGTPSATFVWGYSLKEAS